MSNHIHMVISARDHNASDILRDFKKFTSKQIVQAIINNPQESRKVRMLNIFEQAGAGNSRNMKHQFWRQDNQPKELYSESFAYQKLEYIHKNPVEAGIVDKAEDYLYSSARDYYGTGKGLLDVVLL